MGRLLVTFVAAAGFRGCRCRCWTYWARWAAPFPKLWGFLPALARKEAQFRQRSLTKLVELGQHYHHRVVDAGGR
jgi:hypothetical protein